MQPQVYFWISNTYIYYTIEQKIRQYLQEHGYMQRRDLETLCSLTTSTAKRHLNRLCKAGVLKNHGMRTQPLYYLKEE